MHDAFDAPLQGGTKLGSGRTTSTASPLTKHSGSTPTSPQRARHVGREVGMGVGDEEGRALGRYNSASVSCGIRMRYRWSMISSWTSK